MECTILRDEMLAVLYDEADAATVRQVEAHHAVCPSCRKEMASLRKLRRDLAAWTAPDLSRKYLPRHGLSLPRGLAAAAAVLLALGGALGLSGAELRHDSGQWSLRLGPLAGAGRSGSEVERLLAEQEARHRQEIAALKTSLEAVRSAGAARGPLAHDDAALLAKVQDLIRESEARQAVVLNASLADVTDRSEAQRRFDMARMSAGLSYLDGRTGQQVARATELMGAVLQASQQR